MSASIHPVRAEAPRQRDPDPDTRLLIAVTAPDEPVCVIADGFELTVGEELLAFAVPPAVAATWTIAATLTIVAAAQADCGLNEPAAEGQRFYHAETNPPRVPDFAVMVALRDPPDVARVDEAQAWADVDGDGRAEAFRACAGAEGFHVSVWRGFPNPVERIWHRYYYLGYDIEPTCAEAPPPRASGSTGDRGVVPPRR